MQRKLIPIELRRFGPRGFAEFHGDGGDGEIHFDDAVQRRSIDVKFRAERDADRDVDAAEEADFDPEARAHFDADDDVVVEGIPGDQEIAVGGEPELDPVRPVRRFHAGAGHHAGIGEREVGFALEVDDAEQVPVIAEARHHGIFGQRVERRVIAAERQQELRLLEPHEVRKSAGELAIAREQPGVIGELRLNGKEAFGAGEASLQREFDIDQRRIVGGQRHARHAEQADFDAGIERDIKDGGDVDHLERGAAQSGREPEGAAAGGRCIAEGHQRLHGIVGEGFGPVERLNQGERGNGVEIVRHDEAAVVAQAQREAGEIDDGRDAERDEHAAENCDGGVAVRAGNLCVSADGDDADGADLDQQHAVVLDGRTGEFDQPAGDLYRGAAVAEREALEVESPTGGVADVGEGDIDGELVYLSRESGDGHAAIDQQRDVRAGEADADLIDVDGTEAGMHADEEHAGFAIQANLEGRSGHARVVPEPDFEIDGGIGGAIIAATAAGAKQIGGDGIAAAAAGGTGDAAERKSEAGDFGAGAEVLDAESAGSFQIEEGVEVEGADANVGVVDERIAARARDADSQAVQEKAEIELDGRAARIDEQYGDAFGGRRAPIRGRAEQQGELQVTGIETLFAGDGRGRCGRHDPPAADGDRRRADREWWTRRRGSR